MKQSAVIFFWIILGSLPVSAQNIGVNRSSIKWRQINTEAARVIFPKGQDSIANRVATLTEALSQHYRGTIGDQLKKVDIVLQSENTLSNAYVGLGPYRSEFYMTTPQDPFKLGANNWADQLALHEFRHAQQYSNFNVGLSKLGTIFGGQYGRAIANSMAVPDWFWEGDAIWNETVHTRQGRGRIPFFFNAFKSLDFGSRNYTWMKLRNGSLKDYVPNHYDLGYLLVAYGRERYGDSVWKAITHDAAAYKGLFYPMQKAVKRHMGIPYKQFTSDALQSFQSAWKQSSSQPDQWLTAIEKNNVVNYQYPYPTADAGFIALKSSYRQIPMFVKMDKDGFEHKIAVKEIGYDDYFSYKNDRIVYTAYQPDPRWANREYSVIRVLDVKKEKLEHITTHTRYFSPDISGDGEKIVAVEVIPGRPAEVHIIHRSGKLLKRFSADSSLLYSHPKWTEDGGNVVVAARKNNGDMGLLFWDPSADAFRWLLPPSERLVGFPVVQGDTLVYTQSANGVEGLHALIISTGQAFDMQNFATGIYQGFSRDGKVYGSVFTAEGYRVAAWETSSVKIQSPVEDKMPDLYVDKTLEGQADLSATETKTYPTDSYRKSFRLFNFHSWIPEPNEPDYTFTLVGENVLSTLNSELYYNYNTNESSSKVGARFTFGDTYIMPFVNGSQTWSRSVRLNKDTVLSYNEAELGAGLMLPLNLSGGKYGRRLNLSSAINLEKVQWTGLAKDLLRNQDFTASITRLTYVAQSQRALQHIYPRFGQTLVLDYRTLIDDKTANQFLASGGLYLPGLFVNHNLVLTAAYQGRDTLRQYFFSNSFPFSRGYNSINYPRMWRVGVNYHFPLFYPDWGFGGIMYLRRVRANAFYDFTQGKSLRTGITTPFATVGGEMYFDMKFWNIQAVSFGVRYSYLINTDLVDPGRIGTFEFVLPVNLFGR